jgi:hypothetical protein
VGALITIAVIWVVLAFLKAVFGAGPSDSSKSTKQGIGQPAAQRPAAGAAIVDVRVVNSRTVFLHDRFQERT